MALQRYVLLSAWGPILVADLPAEYRLNEAGELTVLTSEYKTKSAKDYTKPPRMLRLKIAP